MTTAAKRAAALQSPEITSETTIPRAKVLGRVDLVKKPARRISEHGATVRRARRGAVAPQPVPASPFIKWVGGKGRLLEQLSPLLPKDVKRRRHVEPFIGGGAMFFARAPRRALIADVNPALVATYTAIRDDLDTVIGHLGRLAAKHSSEHYYATRERYNERDLAPVEKAATFIYLNKTCFNGLHRVNRKGHFNVPMGRYKNPKIVNPEGLERAHHALQGVDIRCQGFDALLEQARPGDFVYFDPPYEPVSRTASFTSYATDGFSQEDQRRLRDLFVELDQRGAKLMLSNSDVPFIRELYADYRIDTIWAGRAINSDASKRGKVAEVVVRNY